MRIGLLGGTFDPPHIGHLIMGERAAEALDLKTVLYIPAADPPHKQHQNKTAVQHRLAMLERAISENPLFDISRVDTERPGPHYSTDTVQILQAAYPQAELHFIMGGDSLRDLTTWHQPAKLLELCTFVVISRPGVDAWPEMHEDQLPGLAERVVMVDAPLMDVSSTEISAALRRGRSVRYLVPDAVLSYIVEQELYRGGS